MAAADRIERSPLMGVVLGAATTLAVLTTLALVLVVHARFSNATITSTVNADRELVHAFIAAELTPQDLAAPLTAERQAALAGALASLTTPDGLQAVTIYDATGHPLASSPDAEAAVGGAPAASQLAAALGGTVQSRVVEVGTGRALQEYLPVSVAGEVSAVVLLVRDASALLAQADDARGDVLLVAVIAIGLLVGLLFLIFRAAHERLARQSRELVEATRRDPLTGLPNHGAAVASVTEALSSAASEGGWLVAALIDIDNFDLFDRTHGHAAGDALLRAVAEIVREEAPAGAIIGRYGPDEFLISGPSSVAHQVRPAVDRIRERLTKVELRVGEADRLPVTISAGISSYPEHAGAVTELLAAAALTLREAKVGGGDTIKVETVPGDEPGEALHDYGVLRGLVTAIDNKDHYTMRHSEEVAYYALLIADELELDEPSRSTLRLAALLHDVGKIGIPDSVLRKPGPFTDDERRVMEQHAVIGDLILRGLRGLAEVAPCVRAHHERWDGTGYPDGLREDGIPRIARIVSVADAFSAMTTSRSYRVGLPVAEALRRLLEGAGTQFDVSLVTAFVELLGRRPSLLLGGTDATIERLWTVAGDLVADVA